MLSEQELQQLRAERQADEARRFEAKMAAMREEMAQANRVLIEWCTRLGEATEALSKGRWPRIWCVLFDSIFGSGRSELGREGCRTSR